MEPSSSAPVAKRYLMSSSPPLAFSTGIHCRGATAAATALLRLFSRMSSGGTSSHARLPFAVAAEAEKTLNPYLQHHHHLSLSSTSQFLPNPKFFQISAPRITVGVSGRSMSRSVSSISSEAADGSAPPLVVLSFYKFADFPDHATMRKPLKELCEDVRVSGGIILAPEGINGSICGTPESVEKVLNFIQADERLRGLRLVESPVSPEDEAIHHGHTSDSPLGAGEDAPFRWDHVRVKLKKEIVTFGDPRIRPTKMVGRYVNPQDWNALISDPDIMVIDVRNTYETRIGMFRRAVDPCTTAFREFASWIDNQFQFPESDGKSDSVLGSNFELNEIQSLESKRLPRVAMYCTGGIRCEKASSFLLSKGFKEVYHLEGGILKYLEEVPKEESLWEGECFVFDKRVSVEHGLAQGTYKLCYGCKKPVSDADMEAPEWEYGVSCPFCFSMKSAEEKDRARARQRQFKAWGIIGGPDKGRRKVAMPDNNKLLSGSV
ncbi:rhodanese-like domain-containing protein 7 [Zingiber officinale]|uniref:rhodanese-like domain-containing protein 7 n=1 Tax=Zingiber officinale TaxID=94328 RepID=UPI001C4D5C2E|nr:rhodanese-like domain-containing protein 7 [Zingiber officinale]